MIKSKVKGETLRFESQLSKRKVLSIPHFHCTQWELSLVLGLSFLKRCPFRLFIIMTNTNLFTRKLFYYLLRKRFNYKNDQNKVFIIVFVRVFQLYAYVASSNMKVQSTVVRRLENDWVFIDFCFENFSTHQDGEKFNKNVSMHKGKDHEIWSELMFILYWL